MRQRAPSAGFTLLEVLIAMLLLALGVVGGVAMQLSALRVRHQSGLLSQARSIAASLAERMRVNAAQMRLADGANLYLMLDYDVAASGRPATPAALCDGSPCDSAQLAQFDLYQATWQVSAVLPAGRIRVCRDASTTLRWDCSAFVGAPVVIKLGWHDGYQPRQPDGSAKADSRRAPRIALAVGARL